MKTRITCIAQHAPYGSYHNKELADIALAAASFDYLVSVIFLGDGVLSLLKHQAPEKIHQKNNARYLSALTLFDTCRLLVSQTDLQIRGLGEDDLALSVELITDDQLAKHCSEADTLLML